MTDQRLAIAGLIPEPLFLLSGAGEIVDLNQPAKKLVGGGAPGSPLHEFLADDRAHLKQYLDKCMGVRATVPGPLHFLRPDGEIDLYQASGLLLEPRTASTPGTLCVKCSASNPRSERFTALTEKIDQLTVEVDRRMRAESELETYQDQLELTIEQRSRELEAAQRELVQNEKLATLGQLTAVVSHELRNPLGTIGTAVFSIGDAIERGEYYRLERSVVLAQRNVGRCNRIITDLLDFTRKKNPNLQATELGPWLEELLAEQELPDPVQLDSRLVQGVHASIDRDHLRRAVINIVTNASQALEGSERGGGLITVTTSLVDDSAVISVHDNGPGIPDETRERIFEPLFSTKGFGIGLGLSIVKEIVESHNGTVQIESEPGTGTAVALCLPRIQPT